MRQNASHRHEIMPKVQRPTVKWVVQAAFGLVGYGLILFLSAGRLDWVRGWVMLSVLAAFMAAHPLILIPINPELLTEREEGIGCSPG